MILFFAGSEPKKYREILHEGGAENALQSFFSLGIGRQEPCNKEFRNYLLDSGGFSARMRDVEIDVRKYAEYLNKYNISFAFNLDTNDIEESLRNQKFLEENTNTYIMPVYHGVEWADDKYRDLIDYYCEFYPYIAVGGLAGREGTRDNADRFLRYVFSKTRNKTMVHGLGVTSDRLLKTYPFATVDSTSWTAMARFATSRVHDNDTAKILAKTRHYSKNLVGEVMFWTNMQQEITTLWKKRGIVWGQLDKPKFLEYAKNRPTYHEWKNKKH